MNGKKLDDKKLAIILAIISGLVAIIGYLINPAIIQILLNKPPVINDLIPTPSSPQFNGINITWTTIAKDPDNDPLQYKFQLSGPSTNYQYVDKQNWSTNNEWVWKTTSCDIGLNYIRVLVKDKKHEPIINCSKYIINNRALEDGSLVYSNINKMYLGKTYYFSACIAMNDSIEAAKKLISDLKIVTEGSTEESDRFSNDSRENVETGGAIRYIGLKTAPKMRVILEGDNFNIIRIYPEDDSGILNITLDRPGYNYGLWRWKVTPLEEGTQYLTLIAEEVHENNEKSYIIAASITVEVIVPHMAIVREPRATGIGPEISAYANMLIWILLLICVLTGVHCIIRLRKE